MQAASPAQARVAGRLINPARNFHIGSARGSGWIPLATFELMEDGRKL
jgi:hypothetical protein